MVETSEDHRAKAINNNNYYDHEFDKILSAIRENEEEGIEVSGDDDRIKTQIRGISEKEILKLQSNRSIRATQSIHIARASHTPIF